MNPTKLQKVPLTYWERPLPACAAGGVAVVITDDTGWGYGSFPDILLHGIIVFNIGCSVFSVHVSTKKMPVMYVCHVPSLSEVDGCIASITNFDKSATKRWFELEACAINTFLRKSKTVRSKPRMRTLFIDPTSYYDPLLDKVEPTMPKNRTQDEEDALLAALGASPDDVSAKPVSLPDEPAAATNRKPTRESILRTAPHRTVKMRTPDQYLAALHKD